MILQCEQCNTKFRLDDAKIKEGGVKVRCSKCKHVFVVQKEAPQEETDFDSFLDGLGSAAPAPAAESSAAEAEERTPVQPADFEEQQKPEIFAEYGETSISATEGGGAETTTDAEAEPKPAEEGFNFDDFAFSEEPLPEPPTAAVTQKPLTAESGFDMDLFAFDNEEMAKKEEPEAGPMEDFSFDSFAMEEESSAAVSADVESVPALSDSDAFSFPEDEDISRVEESKAGEAAPVDFGGFDFDEVTTGGTLAEEKTDAFSFPEDEDIPKAESKTGEAEAVDFGGFDFDEVTTGVTPAEEKPSMEPVVEAPSAHAVPQPEKAPSVTPPAEFAATEEELPPLSIPSRRKGNSIFSVAVIAVSVLVLLVLAGAGFFFLKDGAETLNKLGLASIAKWFGMQAAEEGSITIKNPVGSFVVNKEGGGELFVINGEAVNSFKKPRATIHVKALLYGKNGAVLAQKSAYCGNKLSKEQLATMPMAKIEAAMNNQFGDSLSNLGVQPGKSIPFVLVFANVPKDVVEFSVEVAGSTVASQ
jgi:predicted Zn finger-like uncharacterized protein